MKASLVRENIVVAIGLVASGSLVGWRELLSGKCFLLRPVIGQSGRPSIFIEQHVLLGSIINSNMRKGHHNIEPKLNLQHYTVNHNETYVDPETGYHTNAIEGTWFGVKRIVPIRNVVRSRIDAYLLEFVWRRKYQDDLWAGFIEALKEVGYID